MSVRRDKREARKRLREKIKIIKCKKKKRIFLKQREWKGAQIGNERWVKFTN